MPPTSDHHRNGRFFNPGAQPRGFRDFLRWTRTRKIGPWRPWTAITPGPPPPARVEGDTLRTTFIGHSTVLLQIAGLNFLTDPIWSMRAAPLQIAGPKRHRPAGIAWQDLPPIDAVLLSHNHYDHCDARTLRRLAARDQPAIFCPLGLAKLVRRFGFREIHELDWWQHHTWRGLPVHAVPAQHFSARTPFDRDRTLWCGWLLDAPGGPVYFAADSGFGPHFAEVAARFPHPRLSLLPIGAFQPEWFMGPVHMNPAQALEVHRLLESRESIAIHHNTFALADDAETEASDLLRSLMHETPPAHPFHILEEGTALHLPG